MDIDYKELLKKYMQNVGECEGVLFLPGTFNHMAASHCVSFTENEILELENISKEIGW